MSLIVPGVFLICILVTPAVRVGRSTLYMTLTIVGYGVKRFSNHYTNTVFRPGATTAI